MDFSSEVYGLITLAHKLSEDDVDMRMEGLVHPLAPHATVTVMEDFERTEKVNEYEFTIGNLTAAERYSILSVLEQEFPNAIWIDDEDTNALDEDDENEDTPKDKAHDAEETLKAWETSVHMLEQEERDDDKGNGDLTVAV